MATRQTGMVAALWDRFGNRGPEYECALCARALEGPDTNCPACGCTEVTERDGR
jgi:rubrerythrin